MKTKMPPIVTHVKKCKQTKIAWELSVNYWFDAFTNIYIRPIWHMRCDVFDIASTFISGRFDWELPNSWTNTKILINSSKYFLAKNRYCLCQSRDFVRYMEFTCDVAYCPLICPQISIFIELFRGKDILIYILFLANGFDLTQHQIFFFHWSRMTQYVYMYICLSHVAVFFHVSKDIWLGRHMEA